MKILIKVKTNSSKGDVGVKELIKDKEYIVSVKSKPENNKANIEVISLVSKYFKIPNSNVKISGGFTSNNKILEIKN